MRAKLSDECFACGVKMAIVWLFCSVAAGAELSAPQPLAPPDAMRLTDVATFFRWSPVPDVSSFEIQIAADADFRQIVKTRKTENKGFHKNLYFPREILPAGTFYWRVRAIRGEQTSPWSTTRSITVNTDHPVAAEVIRKIDSEHPLFLMRSRAWDPLANSGHVKEIIPQGLEHVIVVDDIALASEKVLERAKKYEELGLDFVIWNNRCQVPLSTMEYLFQNFSHCIGTAEGEHFDGIMWERGPEGNLSESDFVHRAWTLCAKYGRFYFFADGDAGSYRWPAFVTRDRQYFEMYRRNIVPMFKSTKGDLALHSYGAVQGLMVSGLAENCGMWVDEWIWPGCGFGKLGEIIPPEKIWENRRKVGTKQCPWTYDIQMWLVGIASGATVFHLESAHQWGRAGEASKNYTRFFLPFVRAVVERRLIPSRQAFLDSFSLAVNPDPELTKGKHQKQYAGGYAFLGSLYGIKAAGDQELIPNASRYGIVCLLPPGVTKLPGKTKVVDQHDLLDPARATEIFNAACPARFAGEAFMWECDGTVIVTNSNENQDVSQKFSMPLGGSLVQAIRGEVGVHEYVIAKLPRQQDGFWFQANGEYPERDLKISLTCSRKPRVTVTPASAVAKNEWDDATKVLTLGLSHRDGAVEVELK